MTAPDEPQSHLRFWCKMGSHRRLWPFTGSCDNCRWAYWGGYARAMADYEVGDRVE